MRATGVTGRRLPNPRLVSLSTVVTSEQRLDLKASVMLMRWGQFVDHDLSLAATTPMQTPRGTNIDCCNRRLLPTANKKLFQRPPGLHQHPASRRGPFLLAPPNRVHELGALGAGAPASNSTN